MIKFQDSETYLGSVRKNQGQCLTNNIRNYSEKVNDIKNELELKSDNTTVIDELSDDIEDSVDNLLEDFSNDEEADERDYNLTAHTADRVIHETQSELILESSKFSCKLCADVYLRKNGFRAHMSQKHNIYIKEDEYLAFMSKIEVKVPKGFPEMKIPSSNNYHKCRFCKVKYESVEDLKEHINIHKTFICDQCGAGFVKKCYLTDHLNTHSTERRYECTNCGKKFKSRSALVTHNKSHISARTYTCEICGHGFKDNGSLVVHKRLKHTNERNFHCSKCDLSFKLRSVLNRHIIRRHTQRTKRFVCSFCGMEYLNKNTLQSHVSYKHSGTKTTYSCSICNKTFGKRGYVNKHIRNVHKLNVYSENR